MSQLTVPRRVERILASLGASPELRQDILGDLQEEFAIRAAWDGPSTARRWYYRESLRVAPHLLRDWWGGLGWRDVFGMIEVLVWCAIGLGAVQSLAGAFVAKLADVLGVTPLQLLGPRESRLQALLAANAAASLAIGYFSASMTPRARIPSALTTASFWASFMSIAWFNYPGMAPTWFSALNLITVFSCITLGGVFRGSRDDLAVIPSGARDLGPGAP
jgi:hypothetical protein